MKKFILDLTVNSVEALSDKHVLIKLTDDKPLPEMLPGQFVEVRVDNSPSTFLRRPISINNVDYDKNELWRRHKATPTAAEGRQAQLCAAIGQLIHYAYRRFAESVARRWRRRCGPATLLWQEAQGYGH